jgi:hypothetical protein
MLELLAASDTIRRKVQAPLEAKAPRTKTRNPVRPRRAVVRTTSAAALRGLADRLEPSPSA